MRASILQQMVGLVDRIEETDGPGRATAIARAATAFDGIAVIDGDGTLFEVLAGIERRRQRVAVVPAGGGNSFARELGIDDFERAISALTRGRTRTVDLMSVSTRSHKGNRHEYVAASTFAAGYVADVVRKASRLARLGVAAYALASAITRPRPVQWGVAIGEASSVARSLTGIVVSNTRYLANFLAFPGAIVDDGNLNVLEQDIGWSLQLLHNAAILSRSSHYDPVRRTVSDRLAIDFRQPTLLTLDGELVDDVTQASITCLPRALTCQVPDV